MASSSMLGMKAVNAEDHTALYGEEEPAYRRSNTEYEREREREREAQRISLLTRMQQLQLRTTNLYKRLQSHFV